MLEYLSQHHEDSTLDRVALRVLFEHKVARAVHQRWAGPTTPATRLAQYRHWVGRGLCDTVAAAAKAVAAAQAAEHMTVRHEVFAAYQARCGRVFAINRKVVLAGSPPCVYCGAPATNADHVVPRRYRGSDHHTNLVPSCRPCNLAKGGRTPEQWQAAEPRTNTEKLTGRDATAIRQRLRAGERRADLAAEFSVSLSAIAALAQRRTWKDVP